MQLEAGKYYRTRNGRKAFVAGRSPFVENGLFTGWVEWVDYGTGSTPSKDWHSNGEVILGSKYDHDLVEEWREPNKATKTVWLLLGCGCETAYLWMASYPQPGTTVLAKREITLTEGEGL